jgi:hypothetical protein
MIQINVKISFFSYNPNNCNNQKNSISAICTLIIRLILTTRITQITLTIVTIINTQWSRPRVSAFAWTQAEAPSAQQVSTNLRTLLPRKSSHAHLRLMNQCTLTVIRHAVINIKISAQKIAQTYAHACTHTHNVWFCL